MRFRPCIDLHDGQVKQIIGSTLRGVGSSGPNTNFSSELPPSYYSRMYRRDNLTGGHVIMLGPGNEDAAADALAAWPEGLQVGGGITVDNAEQWLERGASHVIVTSYVFYDGLLDEKRLQRLCSLVGRDRLVLDLSCRRKDGGYCVVTDRWQKFTRLEISSRVLDDLAGYCDEFLVHAVDVEGKCMGVDDRLIHLLAKSTAVPITYAGGVATMDDLALVRKAGKGRLDVTVGSALDIFGGTGLNYQGVIDFCRM
ncbi:MAG TPA: phosphoribosylformimino-5-aminoimidazole carboxamide ribotide isomerase [Desulfobulbus sp.]|nr:phosphoribosylformimino-5-aminoimidazole carboxamide ribotide isomerase [Desulfobulbus sp.]HHD63059.1 phosphoribosylformimino-5-aminoimidazole carboxamide ribotide isomerase [Desulfobulbaceae bacterium]